MLLFCNFISRRAVVEEWIVIATRGGDISGLPLAFATGYAGLSLAARIFALLCWHRFLFSSLIYPPCFMLSKSNRAQGCIYEFSLPYVVFLIKPKWLVKVKLFFGFSLRRQGELVPVWKISAGPGGWWS